LFLSLPAAVVETVVASVEAVVETTTVADGSRAFFWIS